MKPSTRGSPCRAKRAGECLTSTTGLTRVCTLLSLAVHPHGSQTVAAMDWPCHSQSKYLTCSVAARHGAVRKTARELPVENAPPARPSHPPGRAPPCQAVGLSAAAPSPGRGTFLRPTALQSSCLNVPQCTFPSPSKFNTQPNLAALLLQTRSRSCLTQPVTTSDGPIQPLSS